MKEKQKLIDLCFEIALYLSSEDHTLRNESNDIKAAWIAKQLGKAGFNTQAVGCSWGILINE